VHCNGDQNGGRKEEEDVDICLHDEDEELTTRAQSVEKESGQTWNRKKNVQSINDL